MQFSYATFTSSAKKIKVMRARNYLVSTLMAMVTMALPRMSPAQYYGAILLRPVKYPKPHDSTQALSSDYMPSLWLMHSQAFVIDALSMPSCHLFHSPLPLE
uniref:Uncharacterized protein n=1 Tax=Populus davidiana TaxID=266767 RepID=A0A6M2FC81_9ROSI